MSFPQTGLGAKTGLKLETVYGTPVTPCSDMLDIISGDVAGTNEVQAVLTQHGHREMFRTLQGVYDVGGTIKTPIQIQGMLGKFFNGLFGSVSSSALGGGAYRHEFTVAATPYSATTFLPSYTFYRDKLLGIFLYAGCLIQDMTINLTAGSTGEIDTTIVGRSDQETTQQPTLTYPTAQICSWYNATISVNSSPFLEVEKLTAKFANDLEKVRTLDGTRYMRYGVPKQFSTDIDFEMAFDSMDMVRRIWGNVSATAPTFTIVTNTMTIDITSPTEIGSSGQYYQISIELPAAILFGDMPQVAGANDRIMQPLKFKARYDQASAYGIKLTLINNTVDYTT